MRVTWILEGGQIPRGMEDISEQMGCGCLLIGGPDWVMTPPNLPTDLANRKMQITKRGRMDSCPICRASSTCGAILAAPLEADRLRASLSIGKGCCSSLNSWRREPIQDRTTGKEPSA